MLQTLGGAEKAADNHVNKEQEKLQAEPPSIQAGGGADGPAADEKYATTAPSRPATTKAIEKTGGEPEKPAPTPAPPPKAPLPPGPALTPDEKGNVSQGRRGQDPAVDRRAARPRTAPSPSRRSARPS